MNTTSLWAVPGLKGGPWCGDFCWLTPKMEDGVVCAILYYSIYSLLVFCFILSSWCAVCLYLCCCCTGLFSQQREKSLEQIKTNTNKQTNLKKQRGKTNKHNVASGFTVSSGQLIDFRALVSLPAQRCGIICMRSYIIAESPLTMASARGAQPTRPFVLAEASFKWQRGHQKSLERDIWPWKSKGRPLGILRHVFTAY